MLSEPINERVRQIRERLAAHRTESAKYRSQQWAKGGALHYYEAPDDVDFLLSLVAGQVAGGDRHPEDLLSQVRQTQHCMVRAKPAVEQSRASSSRERNTLPCVLCSTCRGCGVQWCMASCTQRLRH